MEGKTNRAELPFFLFIWEIALIFADSKYFRKTLLVKIIMNLIFAIFVLQQIRNIRRKKQFIDDISYDRLFISFCLGIWVLMNIDLYYGFNYFSYLLPLILLVYLLFLRSHLDAESMYEIAKVGIVVPLVSMFFFSEIGSPYHICILCKLDYIGFRLMWIVISIIAFPFFLDAKIRRNTPNQFSHTQEL